MMVIKKLFFLTKFWHQHKLYFYLLSEKSCWLCKWPSWKIQPDWLKQHFACIHLKQGEDQQITFCARKAKRFKPMLNNLYQLLFHILLQTQKATPLGEAIYQTCYQMLDENNWTISLKCLKLLAESNGILVPQQAWQREWTNYFSNRKRRHDQKLMMWWEIIFWLDYLVIYAGLILPNFFYLPIQQFIAQLNAPT